MGIDALILHSTPRTTTISYGSEGNRVKMSLNMFDMNCARLMLACAIWDSSLLSIPLLLKILQRIRTSPKRAGKIHFWTILNFGLFINLSVISIRKINDNTKMRSNYEKMNFSGELYHFPVRMLLESCEKSLWASRYLGSAMRFTPDSRI